MIKKHDLPYVGFTYVFIEGVQGGDTSSNQINMIPVIATFSESNNILFKNYGFSECANFVNARQCFEKNDIFSELDDSADFMIKNKLFFNKLYSEPFIALNKDDINYTDNNDSSPDTKSIIVKNPFCSKKWTECLDDYFSDGDSMFNNIATYNLEYILNNDIIKEINNFTHIFQSDAHNIMQSTFHNFTTDISRVNNGHDKDKIKEFYSINHKTKKMYLNNEQSAKVLQKIGKLKLDSYIRDNLRVQNFVFPQISSNSEGTLCNETAYNSLKIIVVSGYINMTI